MTQKASKVKEPTANEACSETGNELPPFLSGGLTYPEEEKILCKKREQGTRITCSPGSNTELLQR